MRFEIAQINRTRQNIDLSAAIIDVIFACHRISGIIQKTGQRIAKDRAAGVAHMQRSGWVGADIFDIHPLTCPHRRAAKTLAVFKDIFDQRLPDRRRQPQVQKPGASHICRRDPIILAQRCRQFIRDLTRLAAGRLGQNHSGICGHIPVQRIARRLDRDGVKAQPCRQLPICGHFFKCRKNQRPDFAKKVHQSLSFILRCGLSCTGARSMCLSMCKPFVFLQSKPIRHTGDIIHHDACQRHIIFGFLHILAPLFWQKLGVLHEKRK